MIICIVGPTGVGKTKLSIELAKKYNAIIVNCDAMQVYKDMNIATAKIKNEEKEGIKHYLLDICNLEDNYTIYDYQTILELKKWNNIGNFDRVSAMLIRGLQWKLCDVEASKELASRKKINTEDTSTNILKRAWY